MDERIFVRFREMIRLIVIDNDNGDVRVEKASCNNYFSWIIPIQVTPPLNSKLICANLMIITTTTTRCYYFQFHELIKFKRN